MHIKIESDGLNEKEKEIIEHLIGHMVTFLENGGAFVYINPKLQPCLSANNISDLRILEGLETTIKKLILHAETK